MEILEWLRENAGLIFGSGIFVALIKFAVNPYLKKIDKLYNEIMPNGGGSVSDTINKIDNSLESLKAETQATMYISPQPMWKTDADGHCVFVNKSYQIFTGLPYKDCLGDGWTRSIHKDDRERVFDAWVSSMKSGSDFRASFRWVNANTGDIHHVDSQATIISDKKHNIIGAVGVNEIQPETFKLERHG